MTKRFCIALGSVVAMAIAGTALAAENGTLKRPDPASIHFIEGLDTPDAATTATVLGHIFFHRVDGTINVEYVPAERPDPTATKIVMFCLDTHAQVEFPISQAYQGPVPTCHKLSKLKFAAQ